MLDYVIRAHLANRLVCSGWFRSTMNFYKIKFKKITHTYKHPTMPTQLASTVLKKESIGKTKKSKQFVLLKKSAFFLFSSRNRGPWKIPLQFPVYPSANSQDYQWVHGRCVRKLQQTSCVCTRDTQNSELKQGILCLTHITTLTLEPGAD